MANNQLESLEDIFDGKFLRIPDYQRGYAWGEHQLKDFWEDLENIEEDHVHYTGVLTLEKVTKDKKNEKIEFWKTDAGAFESDKVYYIVDGQQRITTSIIFLKVILDKAIELSVQGIDNKKIEKVYEKFISEENINYVHQYFFGYTADNPSYEFLKTKIFGDKSSSNDDKETLYTANLENAKEFFENKLNNFDVKNLELVFRKLTKQFKYNVYEIADDLDVFVAFETMNNRGKKLSNLELLKNRLIYLSTKFDDHDKERLRNSINDCWKTIYEYLGKNKLKLLDDDKFLKNHWIMYHDYSRQKGNDYIVDLLEERYIVKKIQINELKISDIQKYVLSLKESVKHWYYLHNPTLAIYDDQIKLLLDKLYRLNYGAFTPLLMSIFSRDDKYNISEVCNLLRLMEKYIFVIFRVSQRRSNTGDSEFYGYARKYFQKALSIEDIIGTADPVNDKFSGINWWYASYIDIKQFKIYLAEKFKNQDGYYSWSGLSYFLFEYELSLKQQSRNSEIMIHWQAYNEAKNGHRSIEHVMPQALVEQCWKESFSQFDTKQIKNLCNTIGNLTPLSVSKNSALQNYCFEIKKNGKTDEDMVGYSNGSYAEREISKEPQWTINEIKQRGIKLLKFMADHWEIEELKNPDLQENLLFLP